MRKAKLSAAITRAAREKGLSQKRISLESGIPESTLSKDRRENRFPRNQPFLRLCRLLELGGSYDDLEDEFEFAWRNRMGMALRPDLLSSSNHSSPAGYFNAVLAKLPARGVAHIESFTWETEVPTSANLLVLWYNLFDREGVIVRHFSIKKNILLPACMIALKSRVVDLMRQRKVVNLQVLAEELLLAIRYRLPQHAFDSPTLDKETMDWLSKNYVQYYLSDESSTFANTLRAEPLSYFLFRPLATPETSSLAYFLSCPRCYGEIVGEGVARVENRFEIFSREDNFTILPENELSGESIVKIAYEHQVLFPGIHDPSQRHLALDFPNDEVDSD